MPLGVARVLGWLVIAHGLAHVVLPLRVSLAPTMTIADWIPVGLYAIALVGFVAAGLGLVGLRLLAGAISPLLVVASGLSLVAIVHCGDLTLWFWGLCDAALLLVGLWRGYGGSSAIRPRPLLRFWDTSVDDADAKSLAQTVLDEELGPGC